MDSKRYATKTSTRGGARPGAGRPKGSGHKIRLEDLMDQIELQAGMPYAERLAANYAGAIDRADWGKVSEYDRAFLNKIVADRNEIEVTDSTDSVEARRLAFAEALRDLTGTSA
jgi:hypothetical protein